MNSFIVIFQIISLIQQKIHIQLLIYGFELKSMSQKAPNWVYDSEIFTKVQQNLSNWKIDSAYIVRYIP